MTWMKAALALPALLLLGGCQGPTYQAYQAQVDQWLLKPVDQLVLQWGPPKGTFKLSDGTTLMEYNRSKTEIRSYEGPFMHRRFYDPDRIYTIHRVCKTRFIVGQDNVIKSWSSEGNDCLAYPPPA
jgi:hypothetical protein